MIVLHYLFINRPAIMILIMVARNIATPDKKVFGIYSDHFAFFSFMMELCVKCLSHLYFTYKKTALEFN